MTSTTHFEGMPVPQCHQTLIKVLEAGIDRIILNGPPGTGKTYSALTLGLDGKPSFRLVCTEDMTTADVAGMYMPSADGTFVWKDGLATQAWRCGGRLVIDEIDKASGDVENMLMAYTDSVASASIDLLNGETIRPAAGFSAIMTTNIEDPNDLPPALRDRFPIDICIDAPHPAALMMLPNELRAIAAEIVAAPKGKRASLRAFHAFQQLMSGGFALMEAATLVFNSATAQTIVDTLKVSAITGTSELLRKDSEARARAESMAREVPEPIRESVVTIERSVIDFDDLEA